MSAIADPHDADDLATFVHRWADAIAANDVERMATFVTSDWVLIDRPGMVGADDFHAAVASGVLQHHEMTHDVVLIRRIGSDAAVVVTHSRSSGSFQGKPISADEWTSDVLVRQPDGWRCVLTQLTPRSAGD